MRKILLFLSLVLCNFYSLSVCADGIHIGYCDGKLADSSCGLITGHTGSDAEIQAAIFLMPSQLGAYKACQMTSLYVGMPAGSELPSELSAWVRAAKDGEDLASGKLSTFADGWSTISFDSPLTIGDFAEQGLWVGFTYKQSKKLNALAFLSAVPAVANSGWTAKNGKWSDFSSKGILPIEAIIEGDALPSRDLTLRSAEAIPNIIKIGGKVTIKATVRNNALTPAVNPVLNYDIADGKVKGSYTINQTLNYRDQVDVKFDVPADAITDECEAKTTVTVAWADGQTDEYEADNTCSFTLTFSHDVFLRKMLVEEGTGSWCGWCVRGLVGLKEMREQYPNQFIGIGVHNSDEYTVDDYDAWICKSISGFPSCLINRDGSVYDPEYSILKRQLLNMDLVATASIQPNGEIKDGKLNLQSSITFAADESGADYKVVYVVCEDQLPITQSNYYAGGGYGEMGGFESLGSKANINIDDVARAVYPSPAGVSLGLSDIVKKTPYTHELTVDAPALSNSKNAYIVAFIVNGKTGEVVNAEKGTLVDPTGIDTVNESKQHSAIFNLAGQRISTLQQGVNIINGKKVLK